MTNESPTLNIILTIQGQPVTLTLDQARELRDLLNQVVPEKKAAESADWKIDYAELLKKIQERPNWPSPNPYWPLPWEPPDPGTNPWGVPLDYPNGLTAKPYWLDSPRTLSLKWNGAGEQVPDDSLTLAVA